MSIVYDIETGPLDRDWVMSLSDPFPPYLSPAPFDPESVKLGNLKDAAKIEQKISAARAEYEKDCQSSYPQYLARREVYERDTLSKAALDAATGQVLVISYKGETFEYVEEGDEATLLRSFWEMFEHTADDGQLIISFCGNSFDLPFICRRSMVNRVHIPQFVYDKHRYPHPAFYDLAEKWACGGRRAEDRISLDTLDKVMGGPGKQGRGEAFSRLYKGTPEEKAEALEYAINDVRITYRIAQKMGVI